MNNKILVLAIITVVLCSSTGAEARKHASHSRRNRERQNKGRQLTGVSRYSSASPGHFSSSATATASGGSGGFWNRNRRSLAWRNRNSNGYHGGGGGWRQGTGGYHESAGGSSPSSWNNNNNDDACNGQAFFQGGGIEVGGWLARLFVGLWFVAFASVMYFFLWPSLRCIGGVGPTSRT
jgi:hypothetical protein